jgi:small multidrug resistance family-3 protein
LKTLVIYVAAAATEIADCFALWAVTRNGAPMWWVAPGILCLILFGWLLTRADIDFAGRAYAVYGGIYIAASLAWLWGVEGRVPDRWDRSARASQSRARWSSYTCPDLHSSAND